MVSSYKWWWFLAGVGSTLNVVDAIATLIKIQTSSDLEFNPLMAGALAMGVPCFLLVKFVVAAAFLFLAEYRHYRYAKIGLVACTAFYFAALIWHCYGALGIVT